MKRIKKQKTFSKEYYPVVLWTEDLQELCDALKSKGGAVEISTDDYKFESIGDATEYFGQKSQCDLKLSSDKPYAQVEFSRIWTRVYVSPGENSAAVFHDLDELLVRRQRKLPFLYSYWILVPLLLLSFIPAEWSSLIFPWKEIASIVLFVWYFRVMFIKLRRHSLIRFQRHSDARPFWERNRDQLLLMLISAAVGGLITLAGAKLKEHFLPPNSIVQPKE